MVSAPLLCVLQLPAELAVDGQLAMALDKCHLEQQ